MFTTYDLRHFLEGLAILFAIGYWGTMLLLLWFLWGSDSFVIENSTPKKAQNARKHKHVA